MLDASFTDDFFTLFGLPRSYAVDLSRLDASYRDIQSQVHPDKHAHLADADKRTAMQWASRANEGYQTLKQPLARARYLLHLAGHDAEVETNTAMPASFLMEQMELRETVSDARVARELETLEDLHDRLRREIKGRYGKLQQVLDESGDYTAAAALVRELMFEEKLLHEIDEGIAALED
ncbi:MAG TPA: Fe-S protein assembly co-chaperone HscB [Rhodocyclaceae bacterium]|nr:Fe-S protein assembly co-chaperone HscB [Rhodocyclaceae bacterium]